jgi:protein-disulfide isomerase
MSRLKPPINASDHLRGELSAPANLVELGDFECPFCGHAYPVVKALERALGSRLCVAFRNFPIVGVHPHALLAAEAAEAAGAQGRFWEMHDLLFEHQDALTVPDLEEYASRCGLDLVQFGRDLRSHRFVEKIRADLHSGAVSGANGTPTFFVNGVRHEGTYDFTSLYEAITGGAPATLR